MPFVNMEQLKACYAQKQRTIKLGQRPKWDCDEWKSKTKFPLVSKSPKKNVKKSPKKIKKSPKKMDDKIHYKVVDGKKYRIWVGKRGGRYVMFENRKVYL